MVKIRMTRLGRNKLPFYRIVVADSRVKRDGGYIKLLGTYEPFKGVVNIDEELVLKYLNEGAQPSDTVRSFLREKGIWKKYMDGKLIAKKAKTSAAKTSKKTSKSKAKSKPKKVFSKTPVPSKSVDKKKVTAKAKPDKKIVKK